MLAVPKTYCLHQTPLEVCQYEVLNQEYLGPNEQSCTLLADRFVNYLQFITVGEITLNSGHGYCLGSPASIWPAFAKNILQTLVVHFILD